MTANQLTGSEHPFTVSLRDFVRRSAAPGFWRGLAVGFVGAFYLFDRGLTGGAVVQAVTANPAEAVLCLATVVGTAIVTPATVRLIAVERERKAKLKQVRQRLGL